MAQEEFTRRALYDLVWSKAMTRVAEDFGISDVALKKICTKHNIPTPPRGYWAKKDAGQAVKQAPFLESLSTGGERIVIRGVSGRLADGVSKILIEERRRRKAERKPNARAQPSPAEPVVDVHAAVAATARALRKAKPDKDGVVSAIGDGLCGISIGAGSVERAIRILDGFARRLEERGLELQPTGKGMRVSIGPDSVGLSLIEKVETRKHEPTEEERAAEERRQKKRERDARRGVWEYSEPCYPEFERVRTGEFSLQIGGYHNGLRRSWNDGKIQRVEHVLDDAAGGVVASLAATKAWREEYERRQEEWRREERRRTIARARAEREEKRSEFVGHYAAVERGGRSCGVPGNDEEAAAGERQR